jgi:hypothetical protein
MISPIAYIVYPSYLILTKVLLHKASTFVRDFRLLLRSERDFALRGYNTA